MSGTRPPVVSAPAACSPAPAARLLSCSGCSDCSVACPLWLLRLPAFTPYAKVKKLILTHYILFIWKDRCMFFSDAAFRSRMLFFPLPDGSPWQQDLCHGAPASQLRRSAPASSSATAPPLCSRSATASRPASPPQRPCQQHLPDGAPPRRPCQQQTSSGGENYSGLASNLAHLGRIC